MKKAFWLGGIFLLALSFSGTIYAEELKAVNQEAAKVEAPKSEAAKDQKCSSTELVDTSDMRYQKSPLNKLGRGAINTLTCLGEVPASIYRVSAEKGEFLGCTLGLGQGVVTSLMRGLSGLYDTVTFAIPPYNKPLM